MRALNEEFDGKLSLAIQIFEGNYDRAFLNQLISSQLDIDRLDYLKRDSFYTGVAEGNISSDRLIAMMNVVNDELVIEQKGIYSVEKFIIARRLMYWQVYLHKTGLVAEQTLVSVLKRAKELASRGEDLFASKALRYFLYNEVRQDNFSKETLEIFSRLDDYDVLLSIKEWINHDDPILARLCKMIIHRNLLRIELQDEPFDSAYVSNIKARVKREFDLSDEEMTYFVYDKQISNQAYFTNKPILIYTKNGELKDIAAASDQLNVQALAQPVTKHYLCYPKMR